MLGSACRADAKSVLGGLLDLVILNEVKNLVALDALGIVQTLRVYARDEILHFVQNDKA